MGREIDVGQLFAVEKRSLQGDYARRRKFGHLSDNRWSHLAHEHLENWTSWPV